MAWSDAARAAALEARRAHKKAVVDVRTISKLHKNPVLSHSYNQTYRGNLAWALRDMRKGNTGSSGAIHHAAAMSTFYRNMGRLKRGYRE